MLEKYFLKPDTVDCIRDSWLGEHIERYVDWLAENGYATRNIHSRVPVLRRFSEFAWECGARTLSDLPRHVDPFVTDWIIKRNNSHTTERARQFANEIRGPVEQLLTLILPDFEGRGRPPRLIYHPFTHEASRFFMYLEEERGLQPSTITIYRHWLHQLEIYLEQLGVAALGELSPAMLSAFVTQTSRALSKNTVTGLCCTLRVFLRYLHREGMVARDLAPTIDAPRKYRLSELPRSISWDEVRLMLEAVDPRTAVGKRDYAMLLLLVTYGLRAREVAALKLDDIDWERERLLVPERKAGHCTAYPLSTVVGEALINYIQHARPKTDVRQIFFRANAPRGPLNWIAVADRATHYLRKAGIQVRRPGSHTLRHTCVQRLIDAEFPLKVIADYVGHRSPSSTEIYSKVAVETLREVAMGDGEELL